MWALRGPEWVGGDGGLSPSLAVTLDQGPGALVLQASPPFSATFSPPTSAQARWRHAGLLTRGHLPRPPQPGPLPSSSQTFPSALRDARP